MCEQVNGVGNCRGAHKKTRRRLFGPPVCSSVLAWCNCQIKAYSELHECLSRQPFMQVVDTNHRMFCAEIAVAVQLVPIYHLSAPDTFVKKSTFILGALYLRPRTFRYVFQKELVVCWNNFPSRVLVTEKAWEALSKPPSI